MVWACDEKSCARKRLLPVGYKEGKGGRKHAEETLK